MTTLLNCLTPADRYKAEGAAHLLWPQLHLRDPGRVHHGFGSAKVLYQALPLRWQAHKAPMLGIERGVDTVLEVLGRWYFRPLLLLFAKHSQVHQGDSLPTSKCPCREEHLAFGKLHSPYTKCVINCNLDIWIQANLLCTSDHNDVATVEPPSLTISSWIRSVQLKQIH